MKWNFDHSHTSEGIQARVEFDLATNKPQKYVVSPNILRHKRISLEVICAGCTGSSGNITIHETNVAVGASGTVFTTAETIAVGVDSRNYLKVVADIMTSHAAFEMPATLGSVGKVTLVLTAKEH